MSRPKGPLVAPCCLWTAVAISSVYRGAGYHTFAKGIGLRQNEKMALHYIRVTGTFSEPSLMRSVLSRHDETWPYNDAVAAAAARAWSDDERDGRKRDAR
jgi:hypothetical protein